MLDFSKLGSVFRVKYRMYNEPVHRVVDFDNRNEAYGFKGSCTAFIRKAVIIDFQLTEVPKFQ